MLKYFLLSFVDSTILVFRVDVGPRCISSLWTSRLSLLRLPLSFHVSAIYDHTSEPGEVEEEFARVDTARLIKKFLTSRRPGQLCVPKEVGFGGSHHNPIIMPSWLSEEDINYYATNFNLTSFTSGLNYYRALDLAIDHFSFLIQCTGSKYSGKPVFLSSELRFCPITCEHNSDELPDMLTYLLRPKFTSSDLSTRGSAIPFVNTNLAEHHLTQLPAHSTGGSAAELYHLGCQRPGCVSRLSIPRVKLNEDRARLRLDITELKIALAGSPLALLPSKNK
ncbi:hypothetical protein ACSBR2_021301 [Camellia fascicularis]